MQENASTHPTGPVTYLFSASCPKTEVISRITEREWARLCQTEPVLSVIFIWSGMRRRHARSRGYSPDCAIPSPELWDKIKDLDDALDIVKTVRNAEKTYCRVGDLSDSERLDALPSRERLFLDIMRMFAYRAETRMMLPIIFAQGRKPNARKVLQPLTTTEADTLSDSEKPDPAGAGAGPWKRRPGSSHQTFAQRTLCDRNHLPGDRSEDRLYERRNCQRTTILVQRKLYLVRMSGLEVYKEDP